MNEPATTWVNDGDIIITDDGRELEVTSGNMKWQNNPWAFANWNSHFIRAKYTQFTPTSLWDIDGGEQDFIWYANRIAQIKQKAQTL